MVCAPVTGGGVVVGVRVGVAVAAGDVVGVRVGVAVAAGDVVGVRVGVAVAAGGVVGVRVGVAVAAGGVVGVRVGVAVGPPALTIFSIEPAPMSMTYSSPARSSAKDEIDLDVSMSCSLFQMEPL